jgi:hypothetical protein
MYRNNNAATSSTLHGEGTVYVRLERINYFPLSFDHLRDAQVVHVLLRSSTPDFETAQPCRPPMFWKADIL